MAWSVRAAHSSLPLKGGGVGRGAFVRLIAYNSPSLYLKKSKAFRVSSLPWRGLIALIRVLLVEHDLFRKPVSTFRDHAQGRRECALRSGLSARGPRASCS